MKLRSLPTMILGAIMCATIAVPASTSAYSNYIALGDSVASGAGLGADLDATCDRSSSAYPTLLAKSLGTTVTNLACSGAKVDEGIYGPQSRGSNAVVTPQIDTAYASGKPDLITITIGANDVRWSSFVRDCYTWQCGSSLDKARAVVYRADLRYELYTALQRIDQLSGRNDPTVLVNGYYNPIPKTDCEASAEITATEAKWLNEQKYYLNQSIRAVVSYFDFAEFVPVNFSGHKLCSAETWVQGPNDPAPLHPNAAGQQAIANANLKVLTR